MIPNDLFWKCANGFKWTATVIVARWVSLNEFYQILGVMMAMEWMVSSALLIKRGGFGKWCSYMAGWSIFAKVVIIAIVVGAHFLSDSVGNHFNMPGDLGPWVALAFSSQQFANLLRNSKGLDVDPPPIIDVVMKIVEKRIIQQLSGMSVETKGVSISPTGEISTNTQTATIKMPEPVALVLPSTDVVKEKIS